MLTRSAFPELDVVPWLREEARESRECVVSDRTVYTPQRADIGSRGGRSYTEDYATGELSLEVYFWLKGLMGTHLYGAVIEHLPASGSGEAGHWNLDG